MMSKANILLNSPIFLLTESREFASMCAKLLGSDDPSRQEKGKTQDTLVYVELDCQHIHQINPNNCGYVPLQDQKKQGYQKAVSIPRSIIPSPFTPGLTKPNLSQRP